ncbi:MAG: shikimate kinase [Anaerolineae bacterium]|nr:shikimate kinase [Anaerolineae bacterium]
MKSDRNIVITGFMGTGKTTVGRKVADCLGRPFVDTDDVIVEQAGKSIPEIFAQDGEAVFRHYERRVCRFYASHSGYVIATGGGMLVDPENRRVMLASSLVVCLTASKDAIRARLEGQTGRPLFSGDWDALYDRRVEAYAAIPHQIDTVNRHPETVVQDILTLWQNESQ